MRRAMSIFVASILAISAAGCGSNNDIKKEQGDEFKISMVSDVGGVNDQSFNQSAWEGLKELEKETNAKVGYVESTQASDYATNLDKLADGGNDFIWAIGYSLADSVVAAANNNPTISYGLADFSLGDNAPANVTSVDFHSEQPSFLVGYIAGRTTKSNKVGFIGGIDSAVISQFRYGYQAGVKFAAKELNKDVNVVVQYAETFSDSATGKAIASKMFSDGCDIVFHAAGKVGDGVIAAAVENNKFAIGVDRDQSDKAPDNVLTSALKHVGEAVKLMSKNFMNNEEIGGKTFKFGLKEGCVGIPEKDKSKNVDSDVYDDAVKVKNKIIAEELEVPYDAAGYQRFVDSL